MNRLLRKIISKIDKIDENENDITVFESDINKNKIKISEKNFSELNSSKSEKRIAFIDGGNAEIIGCQSFSLNKIRTKGVIYKNKKMNKISGKDFFLLLSQKEKAYEIDTEPEQNIRISEKNTNQNDDISGFIRRISELQTILEIIDEKECDVVVLDGSLSCTNSDEKEIMKKILSSALQNDVCVLGISKTTTTKTSSGMPVFYLLNNLALKKNKKNQWLCELDSHDDEIRTGFIKLHNDGYIFKIDWFDKQKKETLESLNALIEYSKDPIFLGYPYGLIVADQEARISNIEKEELNADLMMKSGNKWKKIEEALKTSNAHEILDKINF